jgi:hypothetical protein
MSGNAARFPSGRLVVALLILSVALWVALSLVTVPHLQQLAGSLPPFDARLRGYGAEDAQALLLALGAEGRAYYLNPELLLDSIFPPLYAAFGAAALWWLTMLGRVRDGAVPIGWRLMLVAFPVAELVFDGVENFLIARMIWTWPDVSTGVVAVASLATRLKFVAAALTLISLVALAAAAAWRTMPRPGTKSQAPKN